MASGHSQRGVSLRFVGEADRSFDVAAGVVSRDPAGRWAEFRRKYLDELGSSAAMQDFLDRIRTYPDVTLLYASKNRVENHAVILKEFIEKNLN